MKKQTKIYFLLGLTLIFILFLWFVSFRLNLQNLSSDKSSRPGFSFAELTQEIKNIINKSPLSRKKNQPDTDELKKLTDQLAAEIKNSETETELDTSNWLTYTNEEYGFEIKHPNNYQIYNDYENENKIFIGDIEEGDGYRTLFKGIYITITNKNIDTLINTIREEGFNIVYNENIIINEINFNKIVADSAIGRDSAHLFHNNGDETYEIIWNNDNKLQENIVSTFKFLPDTSDWLTYTNEDYDFEFKYPQDWFLSENKLSPQPIENYATGSTNAPILFGIFAKNQDIFLNSSKIGSFGNFEWQIENSERNNPDSTLNINGTTFQYYDLIDSGRYEGDSAGNVLLFVSPPMENQDIFIVFEWQQFPAAKNLNLNKSQDFINIVSTFKFIEE